MSETLAMMIPYAPLLIFVAAFCDIFFLTGLFLYGGATLGAVAMLLATGAISIPELIIGATAGSLCGNALNFTLGWYSARSSTVQRILHKPAAQKLKEQAIKRHLFLTMLFGRYITFVRPLYAIVLGAMHISPRRFFQYEIPLLIIWVLFWLLILLQGEQIYHLLFS